MTDVKYKNIVLVGYMGTGKSTIAEAVRRKTKMQIIDMDQEIVRRENRTITEIFEIEGEDYFRELETNLLKELQTRENLIVSCGGGIVLREENIIEMKKVGTVVLLTVSPETVYRRVKGSKKRPLLNGKMTLEYIKEMMAARKEQYEKAADLIVTGNGKTVRMISEEIIEKTQEKGQKHV